MRAAASTSAPAAPRWPLRWSRAPRHRLPARPDARPEPLKALLRDSDRELTDSIDELSLVDAARRFFNDGGRLANQGLEPNDYINPATGEIDYTPLELEPLQLEQRQRAAALELEPVELEHGAGRPGGQRLGRPDALELEPLQLEPLELVDQLDQVSLARGPERTARSGIAWARRDSALLVPPDRR